MKRIPTQQEILTEAINNTHLDSGAVNEGFLKGLGKVLKFIGRQITLQGYLSGILHNMVSVKARLLDGLLDKYRQELDRGVAYKKLTDSKSSTDLNKLYSKLKLTIETMDDIFNEVKNKGLEDITQLEKKRGALEKDLNLQLRSQGKSAEADVRFDSQRIEQLKSNISQYTDEITSIYDKIESNEIPLPNEDRDRYERTKKELNELITQIKGLIELQMETAEDPAPNRYKLKQYQMEAERLYTEGKDRKENPRLKNYWERNLTKMKSEYSKTLKEDEMSPGEVSNVKEDDALRKEVDKLLSTAQKKLSKVKKYEEAQENVKNAKNSELSNEIIIVNMAGQNNKVISDGDVYLMEVHDQHGKLCALSLRFIKDDRTKKSLYSIQGVNSMKITDESTVILGVNDELKNQFPVGSIIYIDWADPDDIFDNQNVTLYFYDKKGNSYKNNKGINKRVVHSKYFGPKIDIDGKKGKVTTSDFDVDAIYDTHQNIVDSENQEKDAE